MSDHWRPGQILAAVDFDATAEAVLAQGSAWARHFGARLTVLHASEKPGREPDTEVVDNELRGLVDSFAPDQDPRPGRTVTAGPPGPAISAAAASMGADLIVLGSHGRGRVGRWVLGSVAAEVVRSTDVPVLLVKGPAGFLAGGSLVAAVDFSDVSETVIRLAGWLSEESGASLRLLHVLPIGDHPSPGHVVMKEAATRTLRELQDRLVPPTVETHVHVAMRMEATATAIAHHAELERAGLIVMGGHGASGWTRGVLGSVTEAVLHVTSLPVLVVRRTPSE